MIPIFILQSLYGTSIPISKFLLQYSTPIYLAGIRMVFGGVLLVGFNYFFNKTNFTFKKEHSWLYAQIIIFGVYFKYVLRYWSLSKLPAAKLSFMLNSTPFIAALFSYIWFQEKLSKKQWIGMFIGCAGLAPLMMLSNGSEVTTGELLFVSIPELALMIAIVSHVYGMIVARKLIRDLGYSGSMVNGLRMLGGGLLAWVTAMGMEGFFPVTNVAIFSIGLCAVVLISNVVCHSWYLHLLKRYSVTFVSLTDFISPLTTAFYSWMFLGEAITWHYAVSAVGVFLGLYIYYQDELRQEASIKAKI